MKTAVKTERVEFDADGVKLIGKFAYPATQTKHPGVLFLHGAGKSQKESFGPWQEYLANRGYASLAFDFRGVGESEGEFISGSLANRLIDAKTALTVLMQNSLIDTKRIAVVGASMGGHIVANLTASFTDLKAIILWGGAAYTPRAEYLPLDSSFTQVLRSSSDWSRSSSIRNLKKYQGQLLVVYGENDHVIPAEIKKLYKSAAKNTRYVTLEDTGHIILNALVAEDLERRQQLFDITQRFLEEVL